MDPMAFPGIRSTETVGLGSHTGTTVVTSASGDAVTTSAQWSDVTSGAGVEVPLADAYSLRVVLGRRLYDRGIAMQGSQALHAMVPSTVLHLNHFDLDRLGVASGEYVKVNGPRGSFELPVALNEGVAKGTTEVVFATRTVDGVNVIADLVDGTSVISQVRLETR